MQTSIATQNRTADYISSNAINFDASATDLRNEVAEGLNQPAGDALAERDALLLQHMAMVRFVARRIHERVPHHVELDDLISAGMIGLLDAAAKFDGSKQVQFKSYAQFRVRGAILDSLRTLDWSPRELRRKGRAMADAIRSLALQLGRTPSDAEIAKTMGMDLSSYQQLTSELSGLELSSLNAERCDDFGDEELNFLEAPAIDNPLAQYMRGQEKQKLVAALATLQDREQLVLTLYYFEEMTLREIGLTLGVVESRVSQIRSSALARLRSALKGSCVSQRRTGTN